MNLATVTRRLLNAVSDLHSRRLVALVDKANAAEVRAASDLELAQRMSRWANEQKQKKREALTEAVERTDIVAAAVAAELDMLPKLSDDAKRLLQGQ